MYTFTMNPITIFLFTKVASTETLLLIALLLCLFLYKKQAKQKAMALFVSTTSLFLAVTVAKNYFKVPRPAEAIIPITGYAFPSGHAAGATFLAIVVSFLTWKLRPQYRYAVILTSGIVASLIIYSRILLHVHTWNQVLAGAAFGILFGGLFIYVSKK